MKGLKAPEMSLSSLGSDWVVFSFYCSYGSLHQHSGHHFLVLLVAVWPGSFSRSTLQHSELLQSSAMCR